MALALARAQGAPAVGADGRGDHGGGGVRLRPRDAVRYSRTAVRQDLRRAVLVRGADGNVVGSARFNARLADALFAIVNEAVAEDGHQQAQRRLAYEALKNAIDPSPTARRRFEAKGQHAYAQRSAMSVIIATQHRDVVKLPRDDRRFSVITCGGKMTAAETATIRAWMAIPENIGALHRALLATPAAPLDVFDPFGEPPPFAGRLEMIGMGEDAARGRLRGGDRGAGRVSAVHDDAGAAADRLLRRLQERRLDEQGQARRRQECLPAARARRAVQPHQVPQAAGNPLRPHGARPAALAPADKAMIVAALDRTEARVVRIVHAGVSGGAAKRFSGDGEPPSEDEEGGQ